MEDSLHEVQMYLPLLASRPNRFITTRLPPLQVEDSLHEVQMYLLLGSHDNIVALR